MDVGRSFLLPLAGGGGGSVDDAGGVDLSPTVLDRPKEVLGGEREVPGEREVLADAAPRAAPLSWADEARGGASSWTSAIAKTAKMGRKTEGSKAGDADAPVYLWDRWLEAGLGRSLPAGWRGAIDPVRSFLLQQWKRRLIRSFWIWLRSTNRAGVLVSRPPHWSGVEVLLVERAPPGKRYTWDQKSGGRTRT